MIIAIEGGDAAGKATQSTLLAKRLGGVRLAFPDYEQPCGKAILGHLKNEWAAARWVESEQHFYDDSDNKRGALVFQCLQTVNRLELLPVINALRAAERPIVFDRYSASALVYGTLDGLDPAWIELVNASLPQPDLWILLDVPVEEGWKRRPERRDRIESNRAYLERVRTGYLELFAGKTRKMCGCGRPTRWPASGWCGVEGCVACYEQTYAERHRRSTWYVVDGMSTVEEVQARIWNVVEPLVRDHRA